MSKDGPPSGGIYYEPWYKARSVTEVNAHWHLQKQIRRAGHLAKVLRAQGQSDKEISENPEIKSIIANLPRQSRNTGAQRVKREAG
jgi:hypothetical protein